MLIRFLVIAALVLGVPVVDIFTPFDLISSTPIGRFFWASALLIVLLAGAQAVYEKRKELESLQDAARSRARLSPQQRERVQRVKELGSYLVSSLKRLERPLVDPTGDRRKTDAAMLLGHLEAETAALQARHLAVVALASEQLREEVIAALASIGEVTEAAISRAHRAFDVLDAACNSVLEMFPEHPLT
jgi:hypothetical protein